MSEKTIRREWLVACAGIAALATGLDAQSIESIVPPVADRSGRVEIVGSDFGDEAGSLLVDGFAAPTVVWESGRVVAYVPERSALGIRTVELTTNDGDPATASLEVRPRKSSGRSRWRFAVEGDYLLHPPGTTTAGESVYINDLSGRLYALDSGGGLLWIVDALRGQVGGSQEGPVAVGEDGTVYVAVNPLGQDVDLVAVSPQGEIRWVFSDPGAWSFAAGPGIGPDGNVYAVFHGPGGASRGAVSLTPEGELRWSHSGSPAMFEHGGIGAELAFGPALPGGPIDRMFVTVDNDDDRHVYGFDLVDGTQAWAVPAAINDVSEGQTAVAASPAGLTYLTESNGWGLQAFSALDGGREWRYSPGIAAYATNPAAGPDGAGYLGWDGGNLGAVDPDGRERWRYLALDGSIAGSPRVTPDDDFVLMHGWSGPPDLQSGWVKGIDTSTGGLRWQVDFDPSPDDVNLLPDAPVGITDDGRRAYASLKVSGFNPDPKYSYVYALAIDGIEAAIAPAATVARAGETISYRAEIESFEPTNRRVDVWVELAPPTGGEARILLGPANLSLAPGERRERRASLGVPESAAPGGPYVVRLSIGDHPVVSETTAEFELWIEP